MDVPMFFLLIILFPIISVPISKAATVDHQDCPISHCSNAGPVIKFPFRLQHDPLHCGHPDFEVSCSSFDNKTMMKLSSSSGLFIIHGIDYLWRRFSVYDADGCLPKRLLNFTIASSLIQPPSDTTVQTDCNFSYAYEELYNFTLLNCSTTQNFSRGSNYYMPIRCLSVPGHHQVLAFRSSASIGDLPFPASACSTLKPNFYVPVQRVSGTSEQCELDSVLLLEWEPLPDFQVPACQNCTAERESCQFNYTRNQMECYDYPISQNLPRKRKGSGTRSIAIGVTGGCFLLISAAVVAIFYYMRQSKRIEQKKNQINIEKFLDDHKSHVPTRYSYADIKKMTNGFKRKLGEGGFGSVFRGKLPSNGVLVAVKVLKDSKGNGEDFVNEVGTIGRIHHVNVVRLLGFSAEGGKRALIYELMPNSSLEKFISSARFNNTPFDWEKLCNIIIGIAKGIEYLHQGCDQRILHFDIKPHNILLDHDFNPKISDFGLAKLYSKEESMISMTAARGTVGYIAPEVFNGNFGTVSYKSDVYSFGMLVLEIIGARKESAFTSNNSQVYFPELIYECLNQGEKLDLELGDDGDAQIAKRLAIVALWCIQWYPVNRPSMKGVVRMLEGASGSLMMPPNPFASTTKAEPTTALPT
ncbi:rust resistance kinase Lr10-like [Rosa rugosa]|uniref:rust resistance kinase Lr10-like n=1 Tax=Rosa rugosa TaxID=74645 RepID=UPI002B40C2F3|nr:rust resistance kinase Lr10-like [Rosa rugosa]